jgi:hypothetical protein
MSNSFTIKNLKKALRENGHSPIYMGELSRTVVLRWMDLYLQPVARRKVLQRATDLGGE